MATSSDSQQSPIAITLWFVTAEDPGAILREEPKADRGFGRKYLAQLNPRWPITPIGQFPLNRSAPASEGEFYVAGFPGVTVVHTWLTDLRRLSDVDSRLLSSAPARDLYAFAVDEEAGFGGFAHWEDGVLKRSLCAVRDVMFEDVGLPEPFESPYWAGEMHEQLGGLSLPFDPLDLVAEAQRSWLGVEVSPEGPDIHVVGYAVDGRPEPRLDVPEKRAELDVGNLASGSAEKLRLGPARADSVDYSRGVDTGESTGDEFRQFFRATGAVAKRVGRGVGRRAKELLRTVNEKIRYTDR